MKEKVNKGEKKIGRPSLAEGAASKMRPKRNIRFSDDEWKQVGIKAENCNRSNARYIREVCLEYKPMPPDPEFKSELMKVRTDLVRFFAWIDTRNWDDITRERMLSSLGIIQRWYEIGIKPELDFIDKWIQRLG